MLDRRKHIGWRLSGFKQTGYFVHAATTWIFHSAGLMPWLSYRAAMIADPRNQVRALFGRQAVCPTRRPIGQMSLCPR